MPPLMTRPLPPADCRRAADVTPRDMAFTAIFSYAATLRVSLSRRCRFQML